MTIPFQTLRAVIASIAVTALGGFLANSSAVTSAVLPAYSSLSPNASYLCYSTGGRGRQLLEASVSATAINYVVSDLSPNVIGCTRSGTVYFQTPALPPGTYVIEVRDRRGQLVDGSRDESVTISAAPPTITASTLFHPISNTFFATASVADREQLLALGWQIADSGFRVWPANGPAPVVTKPVCRFFYAARSTHFYTANEVDCTALKSAVGFAYEGIAFRALVPFGGRCGLGTKAVYRMFDSVRINHRYTDNPDTVTSTLVSVATQDSDFIQTPDSIIPGSWRDDGIAFCSPIQ